MLGFYIYNIHYQHREEKAWVSGLFARQDRKKKKKTHVHLILSVIEAFCMAFGWIFKFIGSERLRKPRAQGAPLFRFRGFTLYDLLARSQWSEHRAFGDYLIRADWQQALFSMSGCCAGTRGREGDCMHSC